MSRSTTRFAELLQEGISAIADRTSKPKSVIRDELGYAVGRKGGSAIEYWGYGDGHIPRQQSEVETLARALVDEGGLDQAWLIAFLESAGYADRAALVTELFPVTSDPLRNNLPLSPTRFVGRDAELADLARMIADPGCRFITLIGPGGSGKTRLATEAASKAISAFADGAVFVGLAPLSSAEGVAPAVAAAFHLTLDGNLTPQAQVLRYVRQQAVLLVLDNFEHLLAEANQPEPEQNYAPAIALVTGILDQAPDAMMLVTSRERLNIRGEWVYDVDGLETPKEEAAASMADSIDAYSAPTLFVQTARRVQAGFAPADADIEAIMHICRVVGGMPLAIELAAAWVRVLSCNEIAEEIEQSLGLLATTQRDLSPRHRSMQAVFDHSWNLLSPEEKIVFAALSAFRGSFTQVAAAFVADASLPILSALINKSLLRRTSTDEYEIHEYGRQFAAAKLQESGEISAVRQRHERYFDAQAKETLRGLRSTVLAFHDNGERASSVQRKLEAGQFVAPRQQRGARILMLSWDYPPHIRGGGAKHVVELVSQLSQKKLHDRPVLVDVLTLRSADAPAVEQVSATLTIYRIDIPSNDGYSLTDAIPGNALLTEQLDDLVQRHHYDLVHIQDWRFATIGIGLKHQYGIPLIVTFHLLERMRHQQTPPDAVNQVEDLERDIVNEAAQIIVCSQFMRQELCNHFGISDEKIRVIANGMNVDTGAGCPPEEQNILRQQHAPQEQKLLLFVGSAILEKGLSILIRAMPHILTDHPGTRLLVAGKQSDQLLPFAYELHVEDAIDFLGYVSDHRRDCLYQTVDAMIIPSLYEPFGIVALEAMAWGCNVIASKIGGLGEVVKNMENGLTIHPNDPQSIAEAVNRLFADPAAAQQRRARALDEIHTFYRWDRIAGQTVEAYSGLISARTSW